MSRKRKVGRPRLGEGIQSEVVNFRVRKDHLKIFDRKLPKDQTRSERLQEFIEKDINRK